MGSEGTGLGEPEEESKLVMSDYQKCRYFEVVGNIVEPEYVCTKRKMGSVGEMALPCPCTDFTAKKVANLKRKASW